MFFNFCQVTQSKLACNMLCAACESDCVCCLQSYFVCCMQAIHVYCRTIVRSTQIKLCAAHELVLCAVHKLTAIVCHRKIKTYNEITHKQKYEKMCRQAKNSILSSITYLPVELVELKKVQSMPELKSS